MTTAQIFWERMKKNDGMSPAYLLESIRREQAMRLPLCKTDRR